MSSKVSLDENREFSITVDDRRSIGGIPTTDGATVVISVEDPHSFCVVELTQSELTDLIVELTKLLQ